MNIRVRALARVLLAGLACTLAATASAGAYPDKVRPIRIIVPSGAASLVDLMARAQAKAMADVAGLNVVVENKPGAELVIGVQTFMASQPDGYTMLVTSSSNQALNPVMLPHLPYNPLTDYIPLTGLSRTGLVMNMGPSTAFKSAREFIAAARAKPDRYTCASASTSTRLSCMLLEATTGIRMLSVPYKTASGALTAVATGEADLFFIDVGSAKAQWQSGRIRPVAVTTRTRIQAIGQVPTLREEGAMDYEMVPWIAAYFPAKTPPEIVQAMREILRRAQKSKAFTDALANYAQEPLELGGGELTDWTRKETEMWARLVKARNINPQDR